MQNKIKIITLLLILMLIVGCWDVSEIDRTRFPTYITFDQKADDVYRFSTKIPVLKEEAPEDVSNFRFSGPSFYSGFKDLQPRVMGKISLALLRIAIFSEAVAQEGLKPHLDTFLRDPVIPGSTLFAITPGRADEIIDIEVAPTNDIGEYLELLFNGGTDDLILLETTLNDFFISLLTTGVDPIIPLLKYGTDDMEVKGAGIFQNDRMVGQLSEKEVRALTLVKEKGLKGEIEIKVEDEIVNYYIQNNRAKIEPSSKDGRLKFQIELTLDVDIDEDTNFRRLIDSPSTIERLEEELNSNLKREIYLLFDTLQELKSDPIGLGQITRAKRFDLFDPDEWRQDFSRAEIEVDINSRIRRLGIAT
ncbi:Ger(x)C family spore germination protein [Natroniella sulfidigena]|uniref:Ger(x)C family spore germination protein n=1 Tax=Natroniella sulfidigena TaxID=723921 RepID=UPI00200B3D5B|nr:Ger(x)C family spore germination protein [Natroniella sulfidigena]MCK8816709.1 Ger(x)C family spore germination protein [Natroniella sulfidigena]